jgi:toxin ParE1/3/4
MAYRVEISTRARRDYAELFSALHAQDSATAARWHRALKRAILSLGTMPERCPAIRENPNLRHLLCGHKPNVYRIIFRILQKEKRVEVLHIRHGARDAFESCEAE